MRTKRNIEFGKTNTCKKLRNIRLGILQFFYLGNNWLLPLHNSDECYYFESIWDGSRDFYIRKRNVCSRAK